MSKEKEQTTIRLPAELKEILIVKSMAQQDIRNDFVGR